MARRMSSADPSAQTPSTSSSAGLMLSKVLPLAASTSWPSRVAVQAANNWDDLFVILDRFNELWVDATSDLSVPLLLELLRLSGQWTHEWYSTVDPERLGEPIAFVGPAPAPYWLLAAREY